MTDLGHPDDGYSYEGCECFSCEHIRDGRWEPVRPTQGERKRARAKVMDNRRSVMLISALSSGQQRRQSGRRKRGA